MRAAIYVRQSLDKTGSGAAVARQRSECEELVGRHGWEVGRVYTDNDASATKGARPEWAQLLADLDAGTYDVLVCWHTDRLYRRLRDLADLLEVAERRALRIVTVKASDLDLSTPAGRMLAGMLGSAARYEVEQKGARQVAANRARAQQGVVLWTRRPYGFDRDGHEVHVVETEAAEIRKMCDQLLAGDTLAAVARDLNARDVRTSLGNPWTVRTVKQVVTNPRVAGRVVYRGEDMGQRGPAILDAETYDRLCALLRDPRRRVVQSTAAKWLLSGVAVCGRDGCDLAPMLFTTNGRERTPVYRCRGCYGARRQNLVDEVVMGVIAARLARPDAARLLSPDVDLGALQARADELRRRRDGLAAMLADGLLGETAVRAEAKKLGRQIEGLEREIQATTGESPLADVIGADDVRTTLEALSLTRRREIIRTLCEVVILPAGKGTRFAPEQVDIRWKS